MMMSSSDYAIGNLRTLAEHYWDASDPSNADVTDPYLIAAVRRLQEGQSLSSVADYIVETETDRLGLDSGPGIWERALVFACALKRSLGTPVS
jgi:hypothetical protein